MVEISVVVPVYNSEACLEELARQTADALRGHTCELIFVDDRSSDSSWQVIRSLCAQNSSVVGVRLRKNAGQDSAILCGLRRAHGAFVAVMDDDLQHSPYDILGLHAQCVAHEWDVCYAHFLCKKQVWWKNAGSWANDKLANWVIGKPKDLYLSPFKIMRKEIVDEVARYTGAFPYVDGLILNVTHTVGQTEIEHRARFLGESHYTIRKSVLVFLRVATGFSVVPLRLAACVGGVCAVCGFGLAFFYLLQHFFGDRRVEGWTTLVILQLVIGGLLLFSVGVVGEYVGRLYLNSNGKPQSTVKEVING